MRRTAIIFAASVLVFAVMPSDGMGASVTLTFSPPDFQWYHQGNPATPNHVWMAGDYWAQTFTNTGLASATDIDLRFCIDDNILASGQSQNWNVMLNGQSLGSVGVGSGLTGTMNMVVTGLPPIAGPTFTLELLAINTIPPGQGSTSMAADGRSYLVLGGTPVVPAPAALVLAGVGVGVVDWLRRRKTL